MTAAPEQHRGAPRSTPRTVMDERSKRRAGSKDKQCCSACNYDGTLLDLSERRRRWLMNAGRTKKLRSSIRRCADSTGRRHRCVTCVIIDYFA